MQVSHLESPTLGVKFGDYFCHKAKTMPSAYLLGFRRTPLAVGPDFVGIRRCEAIAEGAVQPRTCLSFFATGLKRDHDFGFACLLESKLRVKPQLLKIS
jgi:hypothetical protein